MTSWGWGWGGDTQVAPDPVARKGVESSHRLGRHRWIIEACLSWLPRNRRLAGRYERKAEHFQAFADLARALLSYRRLAKVTN